MSFRKAGLLPYPALPLCLPHRLRLCARRGKLQKGDLVQHTSFGEGIVISVKDNLATIAFEQRYGVRKIMADHPSLSRK